MNLKEIDLNTEIVTSVYIIFFKKIGSNKLIMRDLLNTVDYTTDEVDIELLKECKEPRKLGYLIDNYGKELIEDYLSRKLLIDINKLWLQTNITQVEIEVSSACDYRCRFCPVSVNPRKDKVMSMGVFNEIINKLSLLKNVKYITFSSYNEPLLDPLFEERVKVLSKTDYKLKLITNAHNLTPEKLQFLREYKKVVEFIKINLPSADPEEYVRLTGTNKQVFEKVMNNIEDTINFGFDIKFSVNGTKKELIKNLPLIKEKYESRINEQIVPGPTLDRAGYLKNEYHQNINIEGKLSGWCFRPLTWLVISVTGDIYLCANDYEQKNVYGNIRDGQIESILNNEIAQRIRKQIYGKLNPSKDLICRNCEYMMRGKVFSRYSPI